MKGSVWFCACGMLLGVFALSMDAATVSTVEAKPAIISGARIPFVFNDGQVSSEVKAYAQTFAGRLSVLRDGSWSYALPKYAEQTDAVSEQIIGNKNEKRHLPNEGTVVLNESLVGAKHFDVNAALPSDAKVNFFIGKDEKRWKTGVRSWQQMYFGEVYDDIRLALVAHANNVEKIFTVQPGGHPEDIRLKIDGSSALALSNDGELVVNTELGSVNFTSPKAYQDTPQGRVSVPVAYTLDESDGTYGFVVGAYDKKRPLVIDPLLASTLIGGGLVDLGMDVVEASNGDVVVCGWTESSDYPITAGCYQPTMTGDYCIVVSRFNGSLQSLIASTFIGGADYDRAMSVTEASNGDIIVAGESQSLDYPTTAGAYQSALSGGTDIVISRLNASLSSLKYSTYVGGLGTDRAYALKEASNGDILITGSSSGYGYPTSSGAYQTADAGQIDMVVSRLNSDLSTLKASTYLGGTAEDDGYAMDVATNGDIVVCGFTQSTNYPATAGVFQSQNAGNMDMVISRLDANLGVLKASTYVGGAQRDAAYAMNIASNGDVLITGMSMSANFPITPNVVQTNLAGSDDIAICRLSAGLTQLRASTFLGGPYTDKATAVFEVSSGDVVAAGVYTDNTGDNVGVISLNNDFTQENAHILLGGTFTEYCEGAIEASNGDILVVGGSTSTNYPTTAGAYQTANAGLFDAFVSRVKLSSGTKASNDFNGDGATDLAVYDPVAGRWFIRALAGPILGWDIDWGWSGASPLTGDYNGDGKADLTVYADQRGDWFMRALGGSILGWNINWGWGGITPLSGDYDGDGISDLAVFDQNSGHWYIRSLDGTVLGWNINWGWRGVLPVVGDYDGDGATDLAVYNPLTGNWYIRSLSGTIIAWAVNWGWSGAEPVSGDFNGDGLSDLAVYGDLTGRWYIRTLDGAVLGWDINWGWGGITPLSGDYDGDGMSDLAVFDQDSGRWYIRKLSGAVLGWNINWGWPGVVPLRW